VAGGLVPAEARALQPETLQGVARMFRPEIFLSSAFPLRIPRLTSPSSRSSASRQSGRAPGAQDRHHPRVLVLERAGGRLPDVDAPGHVGSKFFKSQRSEERRIRLAASRRRSVLRCLRLGRAQIWVPRRYPEPHFGRSKEVVFRGDLDSFRQRSGSNFTGEVRLGLPTEKVMARVMGPWDDGVRKRAVLWRRSRVFERCGGQCFSPLPPRFVFAAPYAGSLLGFLGSPLLPRRA